MIKWIDPNTSGIYLIRCLPTQDFYIGSAKNMSSRFGWHRQQIKRGGGEHNVKVRTLASKHRAMKHWEMFPIESVPLYRLRQRERELISTLKPTLNVALPRRSDVVHLPSSMTEWLNIQAPARPRGLNPCEKCDKRFAIRRERYCSQCKRAMLKRMRKDGYFVGTTTNVD